MARADELPFKVVAAFDTETSNVGDITTGRFAFPCLYQVGEVSAPIETVTPDNAAEVITVKTYRDHAACYAHFERLIESASGYVPVVLVHNLGFDMYALAPWLLDRDVRPLARTGKKPISFQVLADDGKTPKMVILDTLGLFMKSLATLGEECGMPKAVGSWDYMRVRTPATKLTRAEVHYAKQDIITLLVYMGYFLRKNPEIDPSSIGKGVQTKTGVVRYKRLASLGKLRGKKLKRTVEAYWHTHNNAQRPKTNDELFTMHAATRGGFTFCAKHNASKVFHSNDSLRILSYDSTSQHPAQMSSHLYPQQFKPYQAPELLEAFNICQACSLEHVLQHWSMPFPYAFDACYRFVNLRPRSGSIFEREGIYSLASARFGGEVPLYDNEAAKAFKESLGEAGYKDTATNAVFAYGKLESADTCEVHLTELEAWVMGRVYEWDSVECLGGYLSSTFRKPPDMAILSVMRFYKAKDALKAFMHDYKEGRKNDVCTLEGFYPDSFVYACANGDAQYADLVEYYALAKSDLNALFGIEATNEARRDFKLTEFGLVLTGEDGIKNLPRRSKCDYYFGQRIVGWSRVAQVCIMEMIAPYVSAIVCGDTDSLKCVVPIEHIEALEAQLAKHAACLDRAKQSATKRVCMSYKANYSRLDGIGHYVLDGAYDSLCAAWNKAYISQTGGKCHVTLAGVPTSRRSEQTPDSLDDFCNALVDGGMSFDDVASIVLGYNVTIDHSITKLNVRLHPEFGKLIDAQVKDWRGDVAHVVAPAALALFPGTKTIGDTGTEENKRNSEIAKRNNPKVNTRPIWLRWVDGVPTIEGI